MLTATASGACVHYERAWTSRCTLRTVVPQRPTRRRQSIITIAPAQEASALKQQYDALDGVLEAGDVPAMLDALAALRRSSGALAAVPEFAGAADRTALLEARLKGLAVPRLAQAIRDQNGAAPLPEYVLICISCIP
jgi:hypothetical protein